MYNLGELQPAKRTVSVRPDASLESAVEPAGNAVARRAESAAGAHCDASTGAPKADPAATAGADPAAIAPTSDPADVPAGDRTAHARGSGTFGDRTAMPLGAEPITGATAVDAASTRWSELVPLAIPCGLMLVGAGVGFAFTLDVPVARERLIGLAVASVLALAAIPLLRSIENVSAILIGTIVVACLGGAWIIAATGPDVFRGTVGAPLQAVFRPLFYTVKLTDPIEVANTRFIIGYNGLADLCLVTIFSAAALLLRRATPVGSATADASWTDDASSSRPADATPAPRQLLAPADNSASAQRQRLAAGEDSSSSRGNSPSGGARAASPSADATPAPRQALAAGEKWSSEHRQGLAAGEKSASRSYSASGGARASYPANLHPTTLALCAVIAASTIILVATGARGGLTGLAAGICAIGVYLWPRRLALLTLVAAPLAFAVAAVGVLDKGLEFSSTAGRLTYWGDLIRLLVEYPFTGVGLGLNTAFAATTAYQINPDPERIFYAHNTFVQSYMETGPLGALGMLALPLVALAAALAARLKGVRLPRKPLLLAGLGIVAAMEAHGLTDQVVTTNVGTLIVFLGMAAILAALSPQAAKALARWTAPLWLAIAALLVLAIVSVAIFPRARAQAFLDIGGLRLNQAETLDRQNDQRPIAFASAESELTQALALDPGHPAALRDLARVHSAQFDDAAATRELAQLAASSRLDAFDMLQIARLYRDQGSTDEAYAWAARAYDRWGRPPEQGVMQTYAEATLTDSRAQNLAEQAEAAMRAREFGDARTLFQQALIFEPQGSPYLTERVGAADRAVAKYGARP